MQATHLASSAEEVRTRIVDAAERLFASGGEEATSLRAITREAGVNVAAIHYHFGGRDELVKAVLDRTIGPLNTRRMQLLDEAAARHQDTVPARALLEAFLRPDLELLARLRAGPVQVARFLGRAYTQPSPVVAGFMDSQFQPVAARLLPLLQHALPELPSGEVRRRIGLVVAVVTNVFATAVPAGHPHPLLGGEDIDAQLDHLLDFFVPALAAAPTGDQHAHTR